MTFLHSTRSQHFTRMFPRCGIPEPFEGWGEYDAFVPLPARHRLDPRAHPDLVVRASAPVVRDGRAAQRRRRAGRARGDRARGLRLPDGGARAARRSTRASPRWSTPGRVLEENQWRAIRHGLSDELIDLGALALGAGGRAHPPADRGRRARGAGARARAVPAPIERMLDEGNAAQRIIRRLHEGATLEETFAEQVRETRESVQWAGEELEATHG